MAAYSKLTFSFERLQDAGIAPPPVAILPLINGASLSELIVNFELERGYSDPLGGYAGIMPAWFQPGVMDYFFGNTASVNGTIGEICVLGCDCGEVGCWPLLAKVREQADRILWEDFSQPHRPARDYGDFGPFIFDRSEYVAAIQELTRSLNRP